MSFNLITWKKKESYVEKQEIEKSEHLNIFINSNVNKNATKGNRKNKGKDFKMDFTGFWNNWEKWMSNDKYKIFKQQ